MSIRADNTAPGSRDRSHNFRLDKVFRFATDSAINKNTFSGGNALFENAFIYQNDNIIIEQNNNVLIPQS